MSSFFEIFINIMNHVLKIISTIFLQILDCFRFSFKIMNIFVKNLIFYQCVYPSTGPQNGAGESIKDFIALGFRGSVSVFVSS